MDIRSRNRSNVRSNDLKAILDSRYSVFVGHGVKQGKERDGPVQ